MVRVGEGSWIRRDRYGRARVLAFWRILLRGTVRQLLMRVVTTYNPHSHLRAGDGGVVGATPSPEDISGVICEDLGNVTSDTWWQRRPRGVLIFCLFRIFRATLSIMGVLLPSVTEALCLFSDIVTIILCRLSITWWDHVSWKI